MLAGIDSFAMGSSGGTLGGSVGSTDWGQVILDGMKTVADWDVSKKALKVANQYNADAYGPPAPTNNQAAMADWSDPNKKKLSLEKIGLIVGIIVGAMAIFKAMK